MTRGEATRSRCAGKRSGFDLSLCEARRIALAAQGFGEARPGGRVDARHLRRSIRRIGLVQIDSVNVVVRSQYMPFFSRLGDYRRTLLEHWAYGRCELFEYWGHVASLIPVGDYPMFRHRMDAAEPRQRVRRVMSRYPGYVEAVLAEVRDRGPLTAGELEDPGTRTGTWWGYGKGKIALEWHFRRGALAVRERRNFARVYDVPERVFPAAVLSTPALGREEGHRQMLRLAARAHGVGTARDLADYYRIRIGDARPRLAELAEAGELRRVRVEGWREDAYLHPEAGLPRRLDARALLTPFDSLVWLRERVERLFGFNYRIEIYVPRGRRQYGYYVMPFLLGEELVARVDLKAQRESGALSVPAAFIEHGQDPARVAAALALELKDMASWLGLERVAVGGRGDLCGDLRRAVG